MGTSTFIGTFGVGHETYGNAYQLIKAENMQEAENIMHEKFGKYFAEVYTLEQYMELQSEGIFAGHKQLPYLEKKLGVVQEIVDLVNKIQELQEDSGMEIERVLVNTSGNEVALNQELFFDTFPNQNYDVEKIQKFVGLSAEEDGINVTCMLTDDEVERLKGTKMADYRHIRHQLH